MSYPRSASIMGSERDSASAEKGLEPSYPLATPETESTTIQSQDSPVTSSPTGQDERPLLIGPYGRGENAMKAKINVKKAAGSEATNTLNLNVTHSDVVNVNVTRGRNIGVAGPVRLVRVESEEVLVTVSSIPTLADHIENDTEGTVAVQVKETWGSEDSSAETGDWLSSVLETNEWSTGTPRTDWPTNSLQTEDWTTHAPQTNNLPTNTPQAEDWPTDTPQTKDWTTDTPQTEDWPTDTPQTKDWTTDTPQTEDWPTDTPQNVDWPTDTPQNVDWTTDTPKTADWTTDTPQTEDWTTDAPQTEDWPTDTPQTEDWTTDAPQTEDWITDTSQIEDWPTDTPQTEDWTTDTSQIEDWPTDTPQTEDWPTDTPQTEDWTPTLPPTHTPDTLQDTVDEVIRITTREPDFLLEASPTSGSTPAITELPMDNFFNFDLAITTTRAGLQVDARDVTFDPSQIAKATSYEGSSYPTATRSATVTTTWEDPEDRATQRHRGNLTSLEGKRENTTNPRGSELPKHTWGSDADYFENKDSSLSPVEHYFGMEERPVEGDEAVGVPVTVSLPMEPPREGHLNGKNSDVHSELPNVTLEYVPGKNSENGTGNIPVASITLEGLRDGGDSIRQDTSNTSEESLVYELPAATREDGSPLSPSVVVALAVCCGVVLVLGVLSVVLWVFRRHRNRSKVYLSREAAAPRAFFTRPMNPAVLPEDGDSDTLYVLEFHRPRAPIMLSDDQRGIYFIKQPDDALEGQVGAENAGFTDIPLDEVKDVSMESRVKQEPPKYDIKYKRDSDTDSGIRVWSSSGSLHTASPQVTRCSLPPPPYSPSISRESVCLAVHSLPSLPRNSQLLNV